MHKHTHTYTHTHTHIYIYIYFYLSSYCCNKFRLTFAQPKVFLIALIPKGYTCTPCMFTPFCLQNKEYLAKSNCLCFLLPNRYIFFCPFLCYCFPKYYHLWKVGNHITNYFLMYYSQLLGVMNTQKICRTIP